MAENPPSGTVTFLLTDLEGSTRMWEQDPVAMKAAMVRHDELLEKNIAEHRGHVFARMGDGMAAAFATARDALAAAAAFQQGLIAEPWATTRPLRARIGLHTDEAVIVDDTGYASLPINRCSRLMTAAHGGQTVVSGATEMLMRGQLPDDMELVDLGEHRLRDLGRPTRIFQLIHEVERENFPPLRTLDSYPGNLPAQVSSFIGRSADVARVTAALDASRVVTVTGVGGVGKTRLALQVAADVLPIYRDGAWLVELASVRDPNGIVEAVAAVFRHSTRAAGSLEESLLEMLSTKQLLLVLDNCEHLIGATARLVMRIERECPGAVVLATSREGLAVEGEQLVALPPLQAGTPGDDIDRVVSTEAVSLFVERARNIKADFALTPSNSRAVVEVCQRLDGLPLAIELAAARVIALSPAELAHRLDQRFQVLAGGRRGAVERHATLRAAIDWSYELLTAAEQRLLARMAVFSGGSTLEAIEEICSGAPVERGEVMDLVTGLVARSLVVADDTVLGTRFRLLETIRQYGEERLADWGETSAVMIRHARFFADLSARAAEHFYGAEQHVWGRRINLDRDNIRLALANAIDAADAELAVQLVANHPHPQSYGATGEVFEAPASRVLELPGARAEAGYPRVLMAAAWYAHFHGEFDSADRLCMQAIEADPSPSGALSQRRVEMDALGLKAIAALAGGAYTDAVSNYARAAELAIADACPGLAAIYLAVGVNSALLGGADFNEMIEQAEAAVGLARRSEMPGAIVMSLNALALALVEVEPERATAVLQESIERSATSGEATAYGVLTAGLVAARLLDWGLTLALAARSLYLERWVMAQMQVAPALALCARALAEDRPEVAGVLEGAAHAGFRRLVAEAGGRRHSDTAQVGPNDNFVLAALREAGDIVASAVGDNRCRELHARGTAMNSDEAITYALANIDPKLLTAPVASIGR